MTPQRPLAKDMIIEQGKLQDNSTANNIFCSK